MTARKLKPVLPVCEGDYWRDYSLMQLRGARRDLSFVSNNHVHQIPGIMSHAAKAVEHVEWMIRAVEKLPDDSSAHKKKGGAR